jgi:hypothetical protein
MIMNIVIRAWAHPAQAPDRAIRLNKVLAEKNPPKLYTAPIPCAFWMFWALGVFAAQNLKGGLAALFMLCLLSGPAFAEETGYFPDPDYYMDYGLLPETAPPAETAGDLEVLLETSPEAPAVHAEWRVRILVNHPNPQEVSVRIPDLPPSLVLDRLRTAARFAGHDETSGPEAGEKWTAADFFFIPRRGGPVSLAPFEVRVPGRLGYSPPVSALVRGGDEETPPFRAAWEASPAFLTAGQGAEIRLRLVAGKAETSPAASVSYRPQAPVNAILEILDTEEARPGEFLLRFRIIPLEGNSVSIPAAALKYGGASITVPSRKFTVLPAAVPVPQSPGPPPDRGISAGNAAPAGTPPAPAFPDAPARVFPPFRRAYERAVEEGRSCWERGLYAEALAALRRNERELAAGPALAPLRRSAETALGIEFAEDERWRPRRLFLALAITASCLLIFLLAAAGVKGGKREISPVTSGPSWSYTFIVILLFIAGGAGFYGFMGRPGGITRPGGTGVLREAEAFRVPEEGSRPGMFFRQGEPVQIRSRAGAWAYVESFEGKAGWVRLDRIIPY